MGSKESDIEKDLEARKPQRILANRSFFWGGMQNFVLDWKLCVFTDSEYESHEESFLKKQFTVFKACLLRTSTDMGLKSGPFSS